MNDVRHAPGRVDEPGQPDLLALHLHVLTEEVSLAVELPDDAVEVRAGRKTLSDVFELAYVHMVSVVLNALKLSIHISKLRHRKVVGLRNAPEVADSERSLAFECCLHRVSH